MNIKTLKFIPRYSTHIPVLLQALKLTSGDVLELGSGVFSTPLLHWVCTAEKRNLLTVDNDLDFYTWEKDFTNSYHKFLFVEDWDLAKIEKNWDVVLVDHSPAERRIYDIERLLNFAKFIIVHDTNFRHDHMYHYSRIYDLFLYKYTFGGVYPSTGVLSNFEDVSTFMEGSGL